MGFHGISDQGMDVSFCCLESLDGVLEMFIYKYMKSRVFIFRIFHLFMG